MNPRRRTFIGLRQAPPPAAISGPDADPSVRMVASIGTTCMAHNGVICRTCGESCEVGAIRFPLRAGGVALPQLDELACNGCQDCLRDCPSAAITLKPIPAFDSVLEGAA